MRKYSHSYYLRQEHYRLCSKKRLFSIEDTTFSYRVLAREIMNVALEENFLNRWEFHPIAMQVIGSFSRGTATIDSDINVVLEYHGKMRSDDVFNMFARDLSVYFCLNQDKGDCTPGMEIDIMPIHENKEGTIDEWLDEHGIEYNPWFF